MASNNGNEVFSGNDGMVICHTSQGLEVEARLLKLTRFQVVFEIHSPASVLQMSEVLSDFRITIGGRTTFSGRAVVSNLINMGSVAVCEAALDESWIDIEAVPPAGEQHVRAEFDGFLKRWQKNYQVMPEFKVVVADIQSLLADLRLWLDQLELGIRSLPSGDRIKAERQLAEDLGAAITPALCALFEKFEVAAQAVPEGLQSAHRIFCRRLLHPLLLSSPFMHRIYAKPLGYAGDYEMVSMILRDPYEGSSLFAKLLNGFILSQSPAIAHRNRVSFLVQKLIVETLRVSRQGRPARIFNIACGPAGEIQTFLREQHISSETHFTLLDSNDETLMYIGRTFDELARKHGRRASVKLVKKSVQQLIKQNGKPKGADQAYDFIYCAGLFDYLNDRICKVLMSHFYDLLAPGGLLVATNVDASNPIRNIMEYIFEWHLIYRTGKEFATLAPADAPPDNVVISAESTSSNIFMEIRKPALTE